MILGQDKQYEGVLSTFPFLDSSMPVSDGFIFEPGWFTQCIFYIVPDRIMLPIRMSRIYVAQECIGLQFSDASGVIATALLRRSQHNYRTVRIVDSYGITCGLLTYDTTIVLYLLPILNIMHGGSWDTPSGSFILDSAVLVPLSNIGVQRIVDAQDKLVDTVILQTNICYDNVDSKINMLCDIQPIAGAAIQQLVVSGTQSGQAYVQPTIDTVVSSKHITLTHSIKSDVRVITDSNDIVVTGAADI